MRQAATSPSSSPATVASEVSAPSSSSLIAQSSLPQIAARWSAYKRKKNPGGVPSTKQAQQEEGEGARAVKDRRMAKVEGGGKRQAETSHQARQLRVATHRVSTSATAVEISPGLDERLIGGIGEREGDGSDEGARTGTGGLSVFLLHHPRHPLFVIVHCALYGVLDIPTIPVQ